MIPFGVSFDGFVPASEAAATAKIAEECGARSFWVAEHLGFRETFVTSLIVAHSTSRARVFPTSISPYLRHPVPTAMTLMTLAEYLPARFGIAVGVGNPLFLSESGLSIEKPIKAVRDYVSALRRLFSTNPVSIQAQTFQLNEARLAFRAPEQPPIFIAPMGPQMLALSGKIGDGLVLSAGLSVDYVRQSLRIATQSAVETGRAPTDIRKVAYIYLIVGGDSDDRDQKIRQKLAFLFRNKNIAENLRSTGLRVDQESIIDAISKRDTQTAMSLVPPEAAQVLTISGDANECKRRAREYFDAGLEELIFSLVGTQTDRMRSLEAAKSF